MRKVYMVAAVLGMSLPFLAWAGKTFDVSCPDHIDIKIDRTGDTGVEGGCFLTPSVTTSAAADGWALTDTSKSTHVCQVGTVSGKYTSSPANKVSVKDKRNLFCSYSFGNGPIIDTMTRELKKVEKADVTCETKGTHEFTCKSK